MGSARGALLTAAKRVNIPVTDYAHRVVLGEKWCTGCTAWHAIEVFGQDPTRRDGRAATCPEGRRVRSRTLKGRA